MKEKDIIKKWLDHEKLSDEELEVFSHLEASDSYTRISKMAQHFRAPSYSEDNDWLAVQNAIADRIPQETSTSYRSVILKIAAVLVIGLGIFSAFYFANQPTVSTEVGGYASFELPDESRVRLSSRSSVTYDKDNWNQERKIYLEGEAFFGVKPGERFSVHTPIGVVSVLGTQFNIKQRDSYLKVTCYEGMVSVDYKGETHFLRPTDVFEVSQGTISKKTAPSREPEWFEGRSLFMKTPVSKVLQEFEWHYGVKFSTKNIDTSKLYTGNFVHSDIQNALRSIIIPLRLKYKIKNNQIILYNE